MRRESLGHLGGAGRDHPHDAARLQRLGMGQHMGQHGAIGEAMQHLRQGRLHARSGTGCQDDHGNGRLHAGAIFRATKPKLMPQDDGSAASIATVASDARQRIG